MDIELGHACDRRPPAGTVAANSEGCSCIGKTLQRRAGLTCAEKWQKLPPRPNVDWGQLLTIVVRGLPQ